MYKLIEKCGRFGLEVVRVFKSHDEAMQAFLNLAEKYTKKVGYYGRLGFKAVLSQGGSNFISTSPLRLT